MKANVLGEHGRRQYLFPYSIRTHLTLFPRVSGPTLQFKKAFCWLWVGTQHLCGKLSLAEKSSISAITRGVGGIGVMHGIYLLCVSPAVPLLHGGLSPHAVRPDGIQALRLPIVALFPCAEGGRG